MTPYTQTKDPLLFRVKIYLSLAIGAYAVLAYFLRSTVLWHLFEYMILKSLCLALFARSRARHLQKKYALSESVNRETLFMYQIIVALNLLADGVILIVFSKFQ
jgi:hypothetical protein